MEDERDAEDAIRGLDRTEFGRKGRRLRVEWTKVMAMSVLMLIFQLMFVVLLIVLAFKLFYFCVVA